MDKIMKANFENLEGPDKELQYEAFTAILAATQEKVDWAYEVWDELVDWLTDADNHRRSRAAQFLAGLAISDSEKRILTVFPTLWEVTKDPRFVTARHSLQTIWRVGLAGEEQMLLVISHFIDRFQNGADEKHYTLRRFDMIQGLKNLYDELKDENIKQTAFELIELEEDPKYRRKYSGVWK
ncbi:hypothetical protein JSQ81_04220 [Sporosarcina sp. Marseille-Q4063]|uniref:hypothetical protein n=1 Tax=Sporosarcina sp. Marseille-Q4063 TaxID=2810514 RepID=UPI001BB018FB|nr:hypothetical protein [Sporosarcina sp. Marseille-Q4063]QUW22798.1 hypothetical protein JSQ81_04220 [Sporosarcina sp. Marseille-Q4063]